MPPDRRGDVEPPLLRWKAPDAEPVRRTMPVAHVWVVGLICLLVGGLLNAPGIRKTALSQPVGWKRDAARFFADPLYDVSHALFLDRLRIGVQDLIGRSGDDDVDPHLPSPTLEDVPTTEPSSTTNPSAGTPQTTTRTTTPRRRAFTPTTPMRLWVGGDSLAVTPGESLFNAAPGTSVIAPVDDVDGHISTGLARPEVFNWSVHLGEVLAGLRPDVIVVALGSNDDQTLTGDSGGQPFGNDAWQAEYRRRVGGLMDQVTGSGATTLFWLGVPQVANTERYDDHYRLINDIARQEAARRKGKVVFVDVATLLAGPDGGYAAYLTDPDGSLVQVRTADGTHYTRAGADRIAAALLGAMTETFDLTSWQTAVTTTTTRKGTATTKPAPKGGEG